MYAKEKIYNKRSLYKFDIDKAKELGVTGNIKQLVENHGFKIVNFEMLIKSNCALIEVDANRITPPPYLILMNNCWQFNSESNGSK